MSDFAFRWLHFSDLHLGMQGQAPLWSNLKHQLFDDLPSLYDQSGPWDLVIFSGDIVQKGSYDEFCGATAALRELYAEFTKLKCRPKFIAVPGNHDIVRPPSGDMPTMLLGAWQNNPTVREQFLNDADSPYRSAVTKALENYQTWYNGLEGEGIPVLDMENGFLPGDQVQRINVNGKHLGIVCLNSTWLQLSNTSKAGDLHVDHMQLATLLPEAESWCRANEFNLIITHHPVEWLNSDNQFIWRTEIAPPGRFDAHLFGHMHEPSSSNQSIMGSSSVFNFQSPSLFGLEHLEDNVTKRIHGYSAGSFSITNSERQMQVWPRILTVNASGEKQMVPNHNFILNDHISFKIELKKK